MSIMLLAVCLATAFTKIAFHFTNSEEAAINISPKIL